MNEFYSCADLEAESLKYTGERNQASSESQLLAGQGAVSYSGSGSPDPALALEPSCLWTTVSLFSEGIPCLRNPFHSRLASSLSMCNSLADKATFGSLWVRSRRRLFQNTWFNSFQLSSLRFDQ